MDDLQLFYEDSKQQLQFMEAALLDVGESTEDDELIGEIFRAMHTIKGTAGMFNFSDIVSFTHIAENLLDEVRNGNVQLNASLASLFLRVKDHTELMIEKLVNSETLDAQIISNGAILVDDLLSNMPGGKPKIVKKIVNEQITQDINSDDVWHISIKFKPGFLVSGMDIVSILRFLNKMGKIITITPIISSIPPLDELNPHIPYIGFELDFDSKSQKKDIEEVFEFVEDDVELVIFKNENKCADITPELKEQERNDVKQIIDDVNLTTLNQEKRGFSLRIDSLKVDDLINKMGEMVIKNSQITELALGLNNEELEEASLELSSLLEEIRNGIMNMRMTQVKDSFAKYRRIVNDTAIKLGKDIEFIIEGEETELDKSVVEKLSDPLTHMIRNSIDHGIEKPEIRIQNGKSPKGKVILRAYPDAGSIVIELEDDGGGINKERVLQKAIASGIVSERHNLSDKEIYQLIFAAGLSTAEQITDISGRGVGMDVVKRNIEDLRGVIDIDSYPKKGSKISVRLPLTLAVIDGFLVQAGNTKYIVPLDMMLECIELNEEHKSKISGASTINVRNQTLPLLNVRKFYKDKITPQERKNRQNPRENVLIVKYGRYSIGLQVDELYGEHQTVIKPLGAIFENTPGISGGSILGNGEVALILDIPKLIEYKIHQEGHIK